MTIDEAIKILPRIIKTLPATLGEAEKNAIRLGEEGLKRVEDSRTLAPLVPDTLLPGETKH